MDTLSASLHFKKNQQGIDTKSTIFNNVHVNAATDSVDDAPTRSKILPPKYLLRREQQEPSAPQLSEYPDLKLDEPTIESQSHQKENEFLNLLDSIKTELLTMKDKSLIMKLIDKNNRIILPEDDLKKLITILTGEPVELFMEEQIISVGCCGSSIKAPFIKNVEKIIVNGEDFEIKHNELFIKMQKLRISLEKVFVA